MFNAFAKIRLFICINENKNEKKNWICYYILTEWSEWVCVCVGSSALWALKSVHNNKANLRDLIAATGLVISNWIQIVNFSAPVTVKFDGWPRKTIRHFFYTMSSFVHHFKSIGEFKLDLQSRNTQFRSKLVICYPMWLWNLLDDLAKQ